jgi:hypothetical protein
MTGTQSPRIAWAYVGEYGVAVISAALIYGGLHQIISAILVVIYPIARAVPPFVGALINWEFHYLPPLTSSYSDKWMWFLLSKMIAIAVIVIVVGVFLGLWANSRDRRSAMPRN